MYVIIGANGFLGSYLIKNILDMTRDSIIATYAQIPEKSEDKRVQWLKLDVTHEHDINNLISILEKEQNINIIYLVAYHHPDMVEKNPRIAWNINVTALSIFLNKLDKVRCFFYPSTDSVYGEGDNEYHFKEEDHLNPVNLYGRHKVAAEALVNAYGYNVVRYPFLIAPSLLKHKKHFYDNIVETILSGKKMAMFADSLRSSLDFDTAAKLLINIIINYNEKIPKVLNVSGDEDLSKYEVGLMIAKNVGANEKLITPIYMDQSEGIFSAKRAKSTLLDNSKLKDTLGIKEIKINL